MRGDLYAVGCCKENSDIVVAGEGRTPRGVILPGYPMPSYCCYLPVNEDCGES